MAFKGVLGWGGDGKVMQLDFLQNKMKAVMNHYRKKKILIWRTVVYAC